MNFRKIVEVEGKIEGQTSGYGGTNSPKIPGIEFIALLTPHVGKQIRLVLEIEDETESKDK